MYIVKYKRRKIAVGVLVLVLIGTFIFPYQFVTPAPSIRYDRDGRVIIGHKQEPWHQTDDIPDQVRNIVVGVEDRRFRWHP